jgi:Fe-S-cluster containining protein
MNVTKLRLNESLPLTCSRKGTCCHGNQVLLNPWELARLAHEKDMSSSEFRAMFCVEGGSVLHFNNEKDQRGKAACGLYTENFGCSVHTARPLACRLFPLGRQVQHEQVEYIFQGTTFPCLNGCSEVLDLPKISVADYIVGQETADFELAQDAYLEIMQDLADIAFTVLLETGLSKSGDTATLTQWRKSGLLNGEQLANLLPSEWQDVLITPSISIGKTDFQSFIVAHNELLQEKVELHVNGLSSTNDFHEAAVLMMRMALFLARMLGADSNALSEMWIDVAKSHGAKE